MLPRSVRTLHWILAACLLAVGCPGILAQTADSPDAILRKAVELHQSGDLQGAVENYQKLIDAGYESPDL
ncbi:MAG: hypothetical protein WAO20_06640, partial [Acidobacteriota bacterium]